MPAEPPNIATSPARNKPEARRDPSDGSRLRRISDQTRGLVDDVKSWVELRMELTQIEVEDRIEERVNEATVGMTIAALAGATLLFLLVAAAVALGDLLGHLAYGFLSVGAVLAVVTIVVRMVKPRFIRLRRNRSGD